MNKFLSIILSVFVAVAAHAQMMDPVHFSSQLKMLSGDQAEIIFSATIDDGWHVYSTDLGNDGPISATFNKVKMEGAETVGKLRPRGNEVKQFDKMFNMELRFFEKQATFVQKIRFTKPEYDIDCYLEYGTCSDEMCLPPSEVSLKQKGKSPVKAEEDKKIEEDTKKAEEDKVEVLDTAKTEVVSSDSLPISLSSSDSSNSLWAPVVDELKAKGGSDDITDHSWLYILLMGFIGGLLAVCMPCIWPIIPMTVSFFLKRAKDDKQKGIRDAITYGLSIIVIFLGLGLLVTALFGSDTLNAMSTNAVFNIFLFLLLVVFALSFFGWFEIKLPDSWANSTDFYLPYGLHSGARVFLLYGPYHRPAPCRDCHQRQLAGSGCRHVGLRCCPRSAVYPLRHVPRLAETGAEVGFVDDPS